MRALIRVGAQVDAVDGEPCTSLHLDAVAGKIPGIRALIKSGADVNAKHRFGGTPLDMAKVTDETDAPNIVAKAAGNVRGHFPRMWRRPNLYAG